MLYTFNANICMHATNPPDSQQIKHINCGQQTKFEQPTSTSVSHLNIYKQHNVIIKYFPIHVPNQSHISTTYPSMSYTPLTYKIYYSQVGLYCFGLWYYRTCQKPLVQQDSTKVSNIYPIALFNQSLGSHIVVFLGTPSDGAQKYHTNPFGEGGLPWQMPKPNLGVMIFNECFGFVEEFDNCIVSFRQVTSRF